MWRFSFLGILFLALSFSACRKATRIDIPFRAYVTVPAGLNTGFSHHFAIRDIPGVDYAELAAARPTYVTLTTEYGEFNMDFVQQGFMYTVKDGVRQETAYQTNLPLTNNSFAELYPSILEVKDHISQDVFDMELKLIFRSIPVTETRIRIDFGMEGTLNE
ncbi:MAG: hypothetical protein ACRBFS_16345 [Aureispira sp.]